MPPRHSFNRCHEILYPKVELRAEKAEFPHSSKELSNGQLVVTPFGCHFHNKIRDRLTARLGAFLDVESLGEASAEAA
jgi:hypothetical protein